jgi:tellurite resistance protein TerC
MIGGATWTWWIGFHLAVALLLLVDSRLPAHRRDSPQAHWAAWLWTACLALAAAVFAGWIGLRQGRVPALQFVAGYAIETSLSIDNLFVFLVLLQGFGIRAQRQHQALTWGVAGAIGLRAGFIAVGVTLIRHFAWVTYLLGAFLLYAAWRLIRERSAAEVIPAWIRRLQPAKGSLLPVILAIEVTDLIFAFDSIPAVLAISHDPFIVYTSNIAAVLGLRALYFGLAGLLDRLRFIHYGLGVLLAFIALKMLASPWIDVPITVSLAILGAILAVCAVVSAIAGPVKKDPASAA